MLLTINKVHTFRSKVKYMGLLLSSKDNLPIITPLGSCMKAISTLPKPLTACSIKSFIGCVIYFAQFLPKLSQLNKSINDNLKNCNKVYPVDKIQRLFLYAKGKGKAIKCSPNIQKYWFPIHTTNVEAIKSLIVQAPVLHLPMALNMWLPFTVQQWQIQLAGTQAQNLNFVAWKNHSCIFNICWNTQLSLSSWTIVPLNGFTQVRVCLSFTIFFRQQWWRANTLSHGYLTTH